MKNQRPIEARTEALLVRQMEELGVNPVDTNATVRWWSKDDLPASVRRLLRAASKKDGGTGRGVPDFAMTSADHPNIVVVFECKPDVRFHETPDHSNARDYAVDGAIHYADFLSKDFDVIAVGVSGQTADELRVSCFKRLKGSEATEPLTDQFGVVSSLRSMDDLAHLIVFDPAVRLREERNLLAASKELHDFIYSKSISTQEQKPLLVAACLIALKNDAFAQDFANYPADELPQHLMDTVGRQLKKEQLPSDKREAMLQPFSFITVHPDLKKPMAGETVSPLHHILELLKKDVITHITTYHDVDVLGQFYGEFLKYVAGDGKGLGIVLTPKHITELFSDLAEVTPDSVVYDPCVGTGGFLISAMGSMLRQAGADAAKQKDIKTRRLVGVEKQAHMFALSASNMLLRGDGKSNLYLDSSLDADVIERVKTSQNHPRPTVGMVNPPYAMKEHGRSELDFIEKMLDTLAPGSTGIAIVPMSVGIKPSPVRERILAKHTLTASMSMPSELFHPVGTVTLILVFKAGQPHDSERPTWFGYWKDDGFVKTKAGRIDKKHQWEAVRRRWLDQYRNRREVAGECVLHNVGATDEWVVEAYLETDFEGMIEAGSFSAQLMLYGISLITTGQAESMSSHSQAEPIELPDVATWKKFRVGNLFTVKRGKFSNDLDGANPADPFVPLISATAQDNGASKMVQTVATEQAGTLTVSINGSIGEVFYQPRPFVASTDVVILSRPDDAEPLTANASLFVATVLRCEKYRYNYGRKWKQGTLADTRIPLPATATGEPDWKQIDRFMCGLAFSDIVLTKTSASCVLSQDGNSDEGNPITTTTEVSEMSDNAFAPATAVRSTK